MNEQGFNAKQHLFVAHDWKTIDEWFFNGKIDLVAIAPRLFRLRAERAGINLKEYEIKFALDELTIQIYMAANKSTDSELLKKLITAASIQRQ